MKKFAVMALTLIAGASACTSKTQPTEHLIDATSVSAMVASGPTTLRYTNQLTGAIWQVDSNNANTPIAIARVDASIAKDRDASIAKDRDVSIAKDRVAPDVSMTEDRGLLGLAVASGDRTFASWTDLAGDLVVSQVAPGPARIIWRARTTSAKRVGGRLAMTPGGRLLVGVGDLGDGAKINDPNTINGKFLTLDPGMNEGQAPNVISSGWSHPVAFAYDQESSLWVMDQGGGGAGRLTKVAASGARAESVDIGESARPTGLSRFSQQELIGCLAGTGELKRYLLRDGRVTPGRTVARGCAEAVASFENGRVAYATGSEIRLTAS